MIEAIKDFNMAIRSSNRIMLMLIIIEGIVYKSKGEINRAIEDYNKAIKLEARLCHCLRKSRQRLSR